MGVTIGPIIGHTTDSTVKVWLRGAPGEGGNAGKHCYGVVDILQNGQWVSSRYCYLKGYYDFTGVVRFDKLISGTLYTVRCDVIYHDPNSILPVDTIIDGPLVNQDSQTAATGEFRTDRSETDGRLRFVFGSCRYLFWDNVFQSDAEKGDKTFRSINAVHESEPLDMVLMIGDQVYTDPLNILKQYQTLDELFDIYRKSFSQHHIRKLMSRISTYMVLDDHEIRNDWSKDVMQRGNQGFFANAMRTYASYQHLHNPDTPGGQYWYVFKRGTFPFFVMDTRTQRRVAGSALEPKTMLGREQLNAFLDWLHQNRKKPMKFVVSSVPFFPDPKAGEDKWAGFPEERSIILEFLRIEKIRNVVFLSGDVHNSSFARMKCHQDPSFGITSLVSSPFYWPYPHERSSNFYGGRTLEFLQWADSTRRIRDRIEYRYEAEGFIGDESFAVVSVDLGRNGRPGQAKILDRKGKPFDDYPGEFVF